MKILEFIDCYPDEHSCRLDLKQKREQSGISCRGCGKQKQYWLSMIYQWKCATCGVRTTLRSGTVMHDSKLSVRTWYLCMALMSMTKKAMSAHQMKRELGHKRYEPN
jgi:hypothetical protein